MAYSAQCVALSVDKLVNTPLISVDLEMTGLDATQNHIIAIGWTQVDRGRIRLASNRHLLINAEQSVGHSAAIHELMDSDVAQGVPLETGLEALFEAAQGRVWLFHHASLDVAFLKQACLAWAGVSMPFMVLDTMKNGDGNTQAAKFTGSAWRPETGQSSFQLQFTGIHGAQCID